MNGRGRQEKHDKTEGDGGNCVREEMEETDLEGTTTINNALFLYRPLTCAVQQNVTLPNFIPALSLQSKMDL